MLSIREDRSILQYVIIRFGLSMFGSFRVFLLILALPVLGGLCVWKIVSAVANHIARDQVADVIIESELYEYRYRCKGRRVKRCGVGEYRSYRIEPAVLSRIRTNRAYAIGETIRISYSSADRSNYLAGNQTQFFFGIAGWVVGALLSFASFAFVVRWQQAEAD